MKQNDAVKHLIELGEKHLLWCEQVEAERRLKDENERKRSWKELELKVRGVVAGSVRPDLVYYLGIDQEFVHGSAPIHLDQFSGFRFEIAGLAPVYVYFDGEEKIKALVVPAVGFHNVDIEYYWNRGDNTCYWEGGSKCIETKDLALAFAHAKRNYEIFQRLTEELEEKKAAKVQQANEPVYQAIPENVDQEFMNSFRELLADVVHKIACEG